eukprot:3397757-Pleurochrysis_carterae.AAC.1
MHAQDGLGMRSGVQTRLGRRRRESLAKMLRANLVELWPRTRCEQVLRQRATEHLRSERRPPAERTLVNLASCEDARNGEKQMTRVFTVLSGAGAQEASASESM